MTLVELLERRVKLHGNGLPLSLIAMGLFLIFEALFVDHEEGHTALERIPGFWALFGFLSAVVIVFFSKWLGHLGLLKREDYYEQ